MITAKDARGEYANAEKKVTSEEGKAILKVIGVILKIVLSNRTNTVKIMEHLKIPKVQPQTKEVSADETEA